MSLLDSVEGMIGGNSGGGAASAVLEMLQNHPGGAAGLAQQFEAGGLGHLVQSWAGSGENMNVSAGQIQGVLGEEHIAAVANKLGITPEEASAKIAEFLPMVMSGVAKDGLLQNFLSKGA